MIKRPSGALRAILLEDDPLDAELITHRLQEADPEVRVAWASDSNTFRQALRESTPHIVLSDRGVPDFNSLDAMRVVREKHPGCPFLLVSGSLDRVGVACLQSGAADYIPKSELFRLGDAIARAVHLREPLKRLSARQWQVFRLLAAGASTKVIARRLHLSVKTVETHRTEAMKRLGLPDLASLVRYALRLGIISAGDEDPMPAP
ncbi:MAG: response regulator transcription factor [Gemmatimonadota bacterium]